MCSSRIGGALLTLSFAVIVSCASRPSAVRIQGQDVAIAGGWRLVSFEARNSAGETRHPLGTTPKGSLFYDDRGHMSAQLMDAQRPRFTAADRAGGTDAEMRAAIAGYDAYYGRYTLEVQQGIIIHHVEGALFPNLIGSDQVRHFRLHGDRLTITTPPMLVAGEEFTAILVWERM